MHLYDKFYVGGNWDTCLGNQVFPVVNPYSEELIATVTSCSDENVSEAVNSAVMAFPAWSQTTVAERASLLRKVAELMKERGGELAHTITTELGMPLKLAKRIQVGSPIATFELTAKALDKFVLEERIGNSLVCKEPAGVVAAITPWNYPLHQIAAKVAPALAVGCTVVLKPSEITPLNAFLLAEILHSAGIPPGVFNLVLGSGPDVGESLVRHPGVDLISFTGSTSAGKRVMQQASESIKRVRLELGGKSASVVLPGADLERAVKATVNSCFMNSGQTCSALTRLIVSEQAYQQATDMAVKQAASFVLGDPMDEKTRLGPLVSEKQRARVRSLIEAGVSGGAKVLAGGNENHEFDQGYFVAPTILGNVASTNIVAQEEIFGPVLSILTYSDVAQAIDIANSTPYGLAGAVWGASTEQAMEVARHIRSGQIDINGAPFNMEAPFGGFKQSGFGRELGGLGLEEYVEIKSYQLPTS